MDLRQIRYFVVLAEELHFRRAAERLRITQAPLSVAIQTLEREFGGSLFHRTQRSVALTELGHAFRAHALDILDRVEATLGDVHDLVSGEAGQLRIGFTAASALLSFFPEVVSAFRTRYPKVRVVLRDRSSADQIGDLKERRIDVGLMRRFPGRPPSGVTFTRLLRDPLAVAMRTDDPLGEVERLTIDHLRDRPLIFYPRLSGVAVYEPFMASCARRGFTPDIVQEARDPSVLIGLAASGLGLAVVPAELQAIRMPHVLFKPLTDEDAMTEIALACRAGEASTLITSFRHMAQAALATSRGASEPSATAEDGAPGRDDRVRAPTAA